MTAVQHVAITNHSRQPDGDIAFHVEAARAVLPLLCRAWGIPQPGIQLYRQDAEFSSDEAAICSAVDSDGNAGTAGFHTFIGGNALFVYEAGLGAWVMIHELEFLINPMLNRWARDPQGRRWWLEAFDPTQEDYFPVGVELFGEKREILAPNFAKPAWFGLPNHDGTEDLDHMRLCSRPFELRPGGYSETVDHNGRPERLGASRPSKGASTSRTALLQETRTRARAALERR